MGILYLAAGTSRSGSTWLYNAARLLLQERHPQLLCAWVGDVDIKNLRGRLQDPQFAALIKIHDAKEDWADLANVIVTCHRDLRDVAVSAGSMGFAAKGQDQIAWVDRARARHDFWARKACIDIAYENILGSPTEAIESLAAHLGCAASAARVAGGMEVVETEVPEGSTYHPVTLLHRGHRKSGVSGRWRDELDVSVRQVIERRHFDWLQRHGYA